MFREVEPWPGGLESSPPCVLCLVLGSLGCGSSPWPALRTNHVTGHMISMMRSVNIYTGHLQERTMSGSRPNMPFVAVCHTQDSLGPHGLVDPQLKLQTLASLPASPDPSGQEATHLPYRPSSWAAGFRPTCSSHW